MINLESLVDRDKFLNFERVFNRYMRSKDQKEVKKFNKMLKELYNKYFGLSSRFFQLPPDELNRLAFVVSAMCVFNGLATSQIRKILNLINSIKREIDKNQNYDISKDRMKLRYILAYLTATHAKKIEPFTQVVVDDVIPKLTNENFQTFYEFVQALVAYHKFLGGKD